MAFFKEQGVNPAGGCLPALLQIPIFIALYQAILNVFPTGDQGGLEKINSVLYNNWLHLTSIPDPNFLGFSLAWKPSEFGNHGALLLLIPVITAFLTFVQPKMMLPRKVPSIRKNDTPQEKKEKESMEDAMASIQGQMVYLMPVMVGYFALQFPIGLAIYWNTFTIMGIIQQYMIAGWGGMKGIIERMKNYKHA